MNYKIKPLEWVENTSYREHDYSAETLGSCELCVDGPNEDFNDEYFAHFNWGEDSEELGTFPTLEKAKEACQEYHDNLIREVIEKFVEIPDVIESKAFVVSQIGAVENLIKSAQEGGDLVAVVQLKQKLQELEQELKGNGSEVKKALEELRAELSEKDMQAIDEELKERGIGVQLVPDPAVPEGCAVMVAKHPGEVKVYVFKVKENVT